MVKDSSDSNEENEGKYPAHNCPHLCKAVQLPAVKKLIISGGFPSSCGKCKNGSNGLSNGHVEKPADDEDFFCCCLRCGLWFCLQHGKEHSNNKTDVHDVFLIKDKWVVRCFKCEADLPTDASKQLLECVEYIRKRCIPHEPEPSREIPSPLRYTGSFVLAPVDQTPDGLPSVRGLANLGNTCFMNATLQCLAQTPFLLPVLEDMRNGGETFRLPGGDVRVGEDTITLDPLEGTLKEWGALTAALAETLKELQSGRSDVFVPKGLRKILEEKCPQFAGYVQHDAHELLRQLLDTVRTEDLKRHQAGILEELHLDKKSERNSVTDRQLLVVKGYGRQAGELLLKPCEVFRGELVSTLVCQRCQHATEHLENFLDLSLPVVADKPVHVRRRVSCEDRDAPSKHQLKKEHRNKRRQARRGKPSTDSDVTKTIAFDDTPSGACDASDEDSDVKEGNKMDDCPTRPLISRYSPDNVDEDDAKPDSSIGKLWRCMGDETPRLSGMDSSESPGGGSDVPNLGSDDNRINSIADDLDKHETNSNEDEDNSIDQEEGAIGGSVEKRGDGDVGESGYSSEKAVNGNSECVSPSTALDFCGLRVASEDDQSPPGDAGATMAPRVYVSNEECTLITCLNQFTAQELLTGNNKVGCEACTERAHGKGGKTLYMDASKQLLISNPPAILILHLKRFQVFGFTSRKNCEDVKFPTILDLAPFCSVKCRGTPSVRKEQTEVRYSLYGVVQHSGGMHGGHYVAYVKVRPSLSRDDPRWSFLPGGPPLQNSTEEPTEPPSGKWYYVSDSNVQEVREPRVLSQEAYVLFYERIW